LPRELRENLETITMRTVLMSSVAALALTFATGSMAPANAQAPAPAIANPSEAPPAQIAPGTAPPSDAGSVNIAPTPDQPATTPPAPVMHHHHMAQAPATTGSISEHWAHEPGTGVSGPASNTASNIDSTDTHSAIAPHLPEPAVGEGAGADTLLQAAQAALAAHHTGAAQQALEMAETRLLDRSTPVDAANVPDQNMAVQQVATARKALASGNTAAASAAIQMAMGGSMAR
jgi:hypothetical protein